jgi:LacI family transcriptional regulator
MNKKISLKDIALEANVSTAAVSYVLNNQEHRVSVEVARKIKAITKKLNYRPNQIAKSLKTNKTHTIGLIVANISYRFTTGITRAVESEAQKNHFTVLFGSSDENSEKFDQLTNVLINRQVDGLILIPTEHSARQIKSLKTHGIPFVLVDRYFPEIRTNYIALDNYRAAHQAVEYILQQGKKHVAFVTYKTNEFHLCERARGYLDALKSRKVRDAGKWLRQITQKDLEEQLGPVIEELVKETRGDLAIFFATDTLAIGGLKHLTLMGVKIPEQVHVASFDEAEAFELFSCSVTHGRQPLEEMGRLAVQTLLNVMENPKTLKQILLDADFVKGKSCGEK